MKINKQEPYIQEESYEEFFHKYYAALVVYAKSFVVDPDEAEDIVQEVFLKLLNKIRDKYLIKDVRSYLYRSIKNQCINYLQHKKITSKYEVDHIEDGIDEVNYLDAAIKTEVFRQVNQALEKLPPKTQHIYMLALRGLTSKEIAEDLGLSVETVKTQRKRAKSFLRKELSELMYALALIFDFILM